MGGRRLHRLTPAEVLCRPRGSVIRPREDETLLDAALREEVPLASSCGGRAVCGDCVVRVVAGVDALSPPGEAELAWRRRSGGGSDLLRLACCLRVRGRAEVATTYW